MNTKKLLEDLGFPVEQEKENEFKQLDNVHVMPFNAFRASQNWALKVHIENLVSDFGADAVVDQLIKKLGELK